ncbi:tRNA pseudouridine(55) synthase TruB [Microvirga solisilvae]|uniref:tRNA pseudouridine(55) synthase TruB n=1 Tax=Microvirga solisilvae TaxID=2919498 RepID=UPI001FAFD51B|nr:tRNA pseudouridine(55) synthase TruB [Microvirga solisilvae]
MTDAPQNERPPRRPHGDRPKKRDVNGWIILDKGVGMTSTHAVAVVKRGFSAKKAGHAGTLDPLASGILPIALGEATKTVPFIMDGRKSYVFTVAWGAETNTDDTEGEIVERTDKLPEASEIEALLPRFIGQVQQVPPRFSAIKIQGERAYDLARDGEVVELQARTVEIDRLTLVHHDGNRSVIEADCGKGTYVRAIARDLGRALGCLGHIAALRRTRVGPFTEHDAVTVDNLTTDPAALRPVETALSEIPSIMVSRDMANRLMRGQSIILRGRDAPLSGKAYATCNGILVAVGDIERGELVPHRVFNLGA